MELLLILVWVLKTTESVPFLILQDTDLVLWLPLKIDTYRNFCEKKANEYLDYKYFFCHFCDNFLCALVIIAIDLK